MVCLRPLWIRSGKASALYFCSLTFLLNFGVLHYWTDVYNHVPHSSIQDQIPFTVHHGLKPDVSWFCSFGCSCTVFRGRDLVDHHKLAPRGERGVFVGLGMSHCRKCWLVYTPRLNCIFASRNVTFDDTLYPLKESDQRVYGYYDNAAITQMRADAYGPGIFDTPLDDILYMSLPGDPISTDIDCNFDILTDQELSHNDASALEDSDVHPAVVQAQHKATNSPQDEQESVTEARGGKGS
eukprot:3428-Rhodomonas_salina.1